MCVVSMVMDHYGEKWTPLAQQSTGATFVIRLPPTAEEIDEFRRLLDRAREYDRKHNEPDCELEGKKNKIRQLAAELGVEVDFL